MSLTHKQQAFVAAYIRTKNATKSAVEAGYSERTAAAIGWETLQKPEIKAEISKVLDEALGVSIDRIRSETAGIAYVTMRDLVTWGEEEIAIGFDGEGKRLRPEDMGDAVLVHYVKAPFVRPVHSDLLPAHVAAAVQEISLGKDGLKIKLHPKTQALDMLAKMVGAYAPEKHEITGADGEPIDVNVTPADLYRAMKDAG